MSSREIKAISVVAGLTRSALPRGALACLPSIVALYQFRVAVMKIIRFDGDLLAKTLNEILNVVEIQGIQWQRFKELNKLLRGFRSHEMTVLSGKTGVGKTTFACEYSLDLAEQGVRTLWGSFEMPLPRICRTLLHQFAGEQLYLQTPMRVAAWASAFQHEIPMFFINTHGRPSEKEVFLALEESVKRDAVEHVILDNLQFMMGCTGSQGIEDKFQRQDRFVERLRAFATDTGAHLTLVVHPRKVDSDQLLTISSLYGGGKIGQEADNILLVQEEVDTAVPKKYLQVVKNRYDGTVGKMDLHFNRSRMSFKPSSRSLEALQAASEAID
ncbi:Twinkle protein [Echinococcus granulosus]|uniref:Twinkle protein n=2 Tax=Echinococcus granulosus TaxID=6210 RepID=W6U6G4_ECHGR|nr:Twinkle protein [Echinococcus granulosus]EUB56790.1 Twinkle protein [Echinococcus granulosus]